MIRATIWVIEAQRGNQAGRADRKPFSLRRRPPPVGQGVTAVINRRLVKLPQTLQCVQQRVLGHELTEIPETSSPNFDRAQAVRVVGG